MFKIILLGILSNSFFSIQASMTREHLIFSKLGYRMMLRYKCNLNLRWSGRYGVRDLVKGDARPRVRSPGPPSCTNNTVQPTYTVEVHSNGSPHTMWKPTVCGRVSITFNTNSIPQQMTTLVIGADETITHYASILIYIDTFHPDRCISSYIHI